MVGMRAKAVMSENFILGRIQFVEWKGWKGWMKTSLKTYNSLSSPMKKRLNNNRKLINTFGPVRASGFGLRAVSYIPYVLGKERWKKRSVYLIGKRFHSWSHPSRTESDWHDCFKLFREMKNANIIYVTSLLYLLDNKFKGCCSSHILNFLRIVVHTVR